MHVLYLLSVVVYFVILKTRISYAKEETIISSFSYWKLIETRLRDKRLLLFSTKSICCECSEETSQ